MNSVRLSSASLLADVTAENGTISAAAETENGGDFSLPTTSLASVAERLQGAKHNHQQAVNTEDSDPAAMQAMLAMLLAQPAQTAVQTGSRNQPGGEMLKMLAATAQVATTASGGQSPRLQQLAEVMDKNGQCGNVLSPQDSAQLSTLSPKLQSLLTSMTQQSPQTPEQQASLTKFAAQDLRAIAPEQPAQSVAQQVANRVKQTNPAVSRPPVLKKNEGMRTALAAQSMTQSLTNVTSQGTQPAAMVADNTPLTTSAATQIAMSSDELGEKLTAMLKDRIQFQLNQQQQTSTIRLDPPSLGKLEIAVQLDAGKLVVHIGANQTDVCRTLQQFSDNLRQHLTSQNFMEVNVQVSSEGQSQQQQQPGHQQDEVKSALALNDEPQHQQSESVLIKV